MEISDLKKDKYMSYKNILLNAKRLSQKEQIKLGRELLALNSTDIDLILTDIASESILSRDWLSDVEEEAWKDL